jgi:hypothetical protein
MSVEPSLIFCICLSGTPLGLLMLVALLAKMQGSTDESAEQLSDHDREILEKFAQRELGRHQEASRPWRQDQQVSETLKLVKYGVPTAKNKSLRGRSTATAVRPSGIGYGSGGALAANRSI